MSTTSKGLARITHHREVTCYQHYDIEKFEVGAWWVVLIGTNDELVVNPEFKYVLDSLSAGCERLLTSLFAFRNEFMKTSGRLAEVYIEIVKVSNDVLNLTAETFTRLGDINYPNFESLEGCDDKRNSVLSVSVRLSKRSETRLGNGMRLISPGEPNGIDVRKLPKMFDFAPGNGLPVGLKGEIKYASYTLLYILSDMLVKQKELFLELSRQVKENSLDCYCVVSISDDPVLMFYSEGSHAGAKVLLSKSSDGFYTTELLTVSGELVMPCVRSAVKYLGRRDGLDVPSLYDICFTRYGSLLEVIQHFGISERYKTRHETRIDKDGLIPVLERLKSVISDKEAIEVWLNKSYKTDFPNGLTGPEYCKYSGLSEDFVNRLVCRRSSELAGKPYDGETLPCDEFASLVLEDCTVEEIIKASGNKIIETRTFLTPVYGLDFFIETVVKKAEPDSQFAFIEIRSRSSGFYQIEVYLLTGSGDKSYSAGIEFSLTI